MIDPELSLLVEKKTHEIANTILEFDYKNYSSVGLLGGLSGVIPFLFEYGNFYDKKEFIELAESYIYDVVEKIQNPHIPVGLSFSGGLSGFGYVLEDLVEKNHIEKNEILINYDEHFCNALLNDLKENKWDALHGAIGISFYLFKRVNSSATVKKTLEDLVDWLQDNCDQDQDGIKWFTHLNPDGVKQYNLGLAHGIPSILFFLCLCIKHEIKVSKSREILDSALSFFLSNKLKDGESLFPNEQDGGDRGPRLAWCYGDLGIATTILHINNTIGGFDELLDELVISLKSRKDPNKSSIRDAGFCHGTAGTIHILHFLKSNGCQEISTADIEHWIRILLVAAEKNKEINYAGFSVLTGNKGSEVLRKEIGLLTGIAGIGNTLLSLSTGDTSWSKVLMV